jgi:myo-inositol 2-dehydrogenase/D-chiro-inositol 1-dehydrogenase
MVRFAGAFRTELGAFTQLVAGERPSPCTLHDAVEGSVIAEAAMSSCRRHRAASARSAGAGLSPRPAPRGGRRRGAGCEGN